DRADQDEADGPDRIQIEPALRYEFEAEIAVGEPRATSAGGDHRGGVDGGNQHGHAEIGIDERAGGLMASVEVGLPTEPEIDRHQHQRRAMGERDGERPKPQLRRRYPRQRPWMAPVGKSKQTEGDDEE